MQKAQNLTLNWILLLKIVLLKQNNKTRTNQWFNFKNAFVLGTFGLEFEDTINIPVIRKSQIL